ncbi:endonuclease III [Candidatus Woesearchaeota archaeon]|nr:MAG: endonuclease III [Candidatus Woesearchaeota archaeon]
MKTVDINKIYQVLKKEVRKYKVPVIELIEAQTKDPFKVLVGTILSARTKDEVTAKAASRLFKTARNPDDFEKLTIKHIEKLIYPVGFYKNKAKFLKELPIALKEKFGGIIPQSVDELTKLPGVGRKTANLVVAVAFNKPAICVDTHVHKIVNRWGYVKTKSPLETEMALRRKLPKKYWKTLNTFLVAFGQHLCTPVSPHCSKCPIREYCNKVGVGKSR